MILLKDFPELRQTYSYDCGAKALQSVFAYYGIEDAREDQIMSISKTTETGTDPKSMVRTIEHYGLQHEAREMTADEIKEFINRGIPVIVPLQAWTETLNVDWKNDWEDGHYVVAIGYDDEKMLFEDPSSFQRTFLSYQELKERWHDVDVHGNKYLNFGIAVYGKEPPHRGEPIPMG